MNFLRFASYSSAIRLNCSSIFIILSRWRFFTKPVCSGGHIQYLLVDIAEEMLSVARKRFSGTDNVSFRLMDYIKEFPISCLSRPLSGRRLSQYESNHSSISGSPARNWS